VDQIKLLYNKGIFSINMSNPSPVEKTVIVLGVARGGTSMVAGALHYLGVPMGEKLSAVYEDIALSTAVEQGRTKDIASIIVHRDSIHSTWGWKRPSAIKHLRNWHGKFRNPFYVVIFRDLFAIANRNRISMRSDVITSMRDSIRQFDLILDFIARFQEPTLFVSYEKAMVEPKHFVCNLRDFVEVGNEAAIDAAVEFVKPNPELYLRSSRITQTKGVLDKARGNRISGWAMYSQTPKRVARLLIKVNDDKEFAILADHFRQDLLDKGIHPTGKCGFVLTLSAEDILRPGDIVSMRVIDDIKDLKNSPVRVTA
jgi:hypothetical protein